MRIVLRGGVIVDGGGAPRYEGDVVLYEGRIERIIAPGSEVSDSESMDIRGLVVSPGFIDMHAHSDLAVLADTAHLAKVAQGVTLEVVGQDGLGYSPVTDEVMAATRAQIEGWNGNPDLDYAWRSVADYLDEVDNGSATNVAVLVPHGTARMTVIGTEQRAATEDELSRIRDIVAQGLRDGAMGMSAGLTYTPGMYASDDEIVHALGALREHGGYYCPHHRNYGSRVVESYLECIEIARRADVALHLAHCHINFPQNRGRAGEVLAAIDGALAEGLDITLDSYPYLAGATYLAALLPSWAHAGGAESTMAALSESESRQRIIRALDVEGSDGNHGMVTDWSTIAISSTKKSANSWAVGHTVAAAAAERGVSPAELCVELLLDDDLGTGCLVIVGNEENVQTVMKHRAHTVGTDGILVGERPHPRGWGTFPRFLGHYARDLGLMSLEEAVLHATSRPAARLGLDDRGRVLAGYWADLVVFDPETISSAASYDEPTLAPIGVHYVFVNGEIAMREGQRTAALSGRAIRRTPRSSGTGPRPR